MPDIDDGEPDGHHKEIGARGQGKPEGQRVGGAEGAESFDHSRMLLDIRPAWRSPRVNCGYGRMGQQERARAARAPRPGESGCGLPAPVPVLALEVAVTEVRVPGPAAHEFRKLPYGLPDGLIRAWLRRPGALRLETADGLVIASTTGINDSRGGFYVSSTRKTWLLPPHLVTPVYDDDGLVRRRPEAAYGEPSFGNGRFAAALDPVELAGNSPVPLEFPNANAVELGPITEVDHEGRPALETTVSPNPSYRPADPAAPLCRPDARC